MTLCPFYLSANFLFVCSALRHRMVWQTAVAILEECVVWTFGAEVVQVREVVDYVGSWEDEPRRTGVSSRCYNTETMWACWTHWCLPFSHPFCSNRPLCHPDLRLDVAMWAGYVLARAGCIDGYLRAFVSHSISAPYSSLSTYLSYQKDKRAKRGNLPKSSALPELEKYWVEK
jgi:hypothetical protein